LAKVESLLFYIIIRFSAVMHLSVLPIYFKALFISVHKENCVNKQTNKQTNKN